MKLKHTKQASAKLIIYIILTIVILAIMGFSFYKDSQVMLIDNPTWTWIVVQIDDNPEITVYSHWFEEINVSFGKHSVTLNWEKIWEFDKKLTDRNFFLNPTNSIYMAEYVLYSESDDYYDKLPNNKVEAYGNEIEWPFKKYEGIYIVWDWSYGLIEDFPEATDLTKWSDYTIRQKVYRFNDFLDIYNTEYVTSGTGELEKEGEEDSEFRTDFY